MGSGTCARLYPYFFYLGEIYLGKVVLYVELKWTLHPNAQNIISCQVSITLSWIINLKKLRLNEEFNMVIGSNL